MCSSSNEELCFCLAVTEDETLRGEKIGLHRYNGLLVNGGNIDLLIENWISASDLRLHELHHASLLILFLL